MDRPEIAAAAITTPRRCLLLGLPLSLNRAVAETIPSAPPPAHVSPAVRTILSTGNTVTSEPIRYPFGAPAQITAVEITLQPGQDGTRIRSPSSVISFEGESHG
jgi:hypothetical protein